MLQPAPFMSPSFNSHGVDFVRGQNHQPLDFYPARFSDRLFTAWFLSAAFLTAACLLVGCERSEIKETRVPRERSGLQGAHFNVPQSNAGTSGDARTAKSDERMMVAMVDRPNATYFLRVQTDSAAVDSIREDFDQILQSLTFANDGMQWKIPSGWTESEGGAMFRIATLRSSQGVEVFITQLTPGQELLPNVNRWQGMLDLPSVTADNMPIKRIQVGEQEVIVYEAARLGGGSSAAAAASPPTDDRTRPPAGSSLGNTLPEIPWEFPNPGEGWKVLPPSSVAAARWEKTESGSELTLEVFKFPAAVEFASMTEIWVGKIGIAAPTSEQLASSAQPITIAEVPGQLVLLPLTSAEETPENAVLIARFEWDSYAWYVKLAGSGAAVMQHQEKFREFLSQISRR